MILEFRERFGALTVQAEPLPGRQRFGVPPGGAFDLHLYRLANALVGNLGSEQCLEIGLGSFTAVIHEAGWFAAQGCEIELDGEALPEGVYYGAKGQTLGAKLPLGARSYLATAGGWGVFEGNRLVGRKEIGHQPTRSRPWSEIPEPEPKVINVLRLTDAWDVELTVTHKLDRVGIRLDGGGPALPELDRSEPMICGTIQSTESGTVILGPDGPTVGGYRRAGVVCTADRSKLAQLRPGDSIRFKPITLEEALGLNVSSSERLLRAIGQIGNQ